MFCSHTILHVLVKSRLVQSDIHEFV
jgi:hypothetical protein